MLLPTRKRLLLIAVTLTAIVCIGGGWLLLRGESSREGTEGGDRVRDLGNGISVEFISSSYKTVSKRTSGFFETGQEADIMLSGIDFNDAGGPLLFNHPGGIASDGTHLILADRNNNRVLIWNTLPTGNTEPDLVLGQKDFAANNPGTGLDEMNWPVAVATDGTHVLVADTYNDRILVWNQFPAENGQPADIELKGTGNPHDPMVDPRTKLAWPWAIWTDGTRLVVTSTGSGTVLIWNNFPTQNNKLADLVLYAGGDFGTPRSVGSNGTHLIVGDHNAKPNNNGCGTFFWETFPTTDDQPYDFFVAAPQWMGEKHEVSSFGDVIWSPTFTPDGKLIGLTNAGLYIWDSSFPNGEEDAPDLMMGAVGETDEGYRFRDGDGSGMALAGGRLYLSLSNANKIVVFNSVPASADQLPDFAIGAPDISTDTLQTNFIISNPVPASDGRSLFVSSDFDRKLYVWKNRPDESGAHPDLVYSLPEGPWDNALYENSFALAGQRSVYVWRTLPTEGQAPDLIFTDKIGSAAFGELRGVAIDSRYFYLSDSTAGKVYVWEGIPEDDEAPKFTLTVEKPTRLSSDGDYLLVTCTEGGPGGSVRAYAVDGLADDANPLKVLEGFNLPQGATVSHGHLFIGDTGYNRVLIWEEIKDALVGDNPDVRLGLTEANLLPEQAKPQIGKDKLFWPAVPFFDGDYLWVGEFKFSERLLRFSPSSSAVSCSVCGD